MSTTKKINLQLGDIVKFIADDNPKFNNKMFLITYIDREKINVISKDLETTIDIKDNILQDESITQIQLIYRNDSNSYAIQNKLIPGTNISIYFDGSLPLVITGKITNLEQDMIELTIYPNKEIIYIDFAYRGIPQELNIEKIVISETQDSPIIENISQDDDSNSSVIGKKTYDSNHNEILQVDDNEFINHDNFDEIFINIDTIEIGPDLEEIAHKVNVDSDNLRYTLDKQIQDYLDYHINLESANTDNQALVNNINHEINRYIELRTMYSNFDSNGNPMIIEPKNETYKPIIDKNLKQLKYDYKWIIPVTKLANSLIIEDTNEILLEDEYLNISKMHEFITEIMTITNQWKTNKTTTYTYKNYISGLLDCFTSYSKYLKDDEYAKFKSVNSDINALINNYDDFTSYSITNNKITTKEFDFKKMNLGLNMLKGEYKNNKKHYVSTELTENDKINIDGIITLPYVFYRYSLKDLGYTNILEKSNNSKFTLLIDSFLNTNTLEYYKYTAYDYSNEKPIDNIQDDNILNNINYFSFDDEIVHDGEMDNYVNLLNCVIPSSNVIVEYISKMYKYCNISQFNYIMQGFNIDNYSINYDTFAIINKYIQKNIVDYQNTYKINQKIITSMINRRTLEIIEEYKIDPKSQKNNLFTFLDEKTRQDIIANYNLDKFITNSQDYNNIKTSEMLSIIYNIDSGEYLFTALNKSLIELVVGNLLETYIKNQEKKQKSLEESGEQFGEKSGDQDVVDEEVEDQETPNDNDKETDKPENTDCKKYILSKKYTNIDDLTNDNDKLIFFSEEYDKSMYRLKQEYIEQYNTMDNYKFMDFIKTILIRDYDIEPSLAQREAKAVVDGKREIIDGDYAILDNYSNNRNYVYIRKDNKWVLDDNFNDNFSINNNEIFCNLATDCLHVNDKCETMDDIKKIKDLDDDKKIRTILQNFNLEYNISIQEIKKNINKKFETASTKLKKILAIKNQEIKQTTYNIIQDIDIIISPYEKLKNAILSQTDLASRYNNIKKFCLNFTRESFISEDNYWLYCKTTSTKLIPVFMLRLANVFINKGDYELELDNICSEQGTISDDNNYWVDKHSGYFIKPIDFASDYMQEQHDIKLTTSEILQEKYKGDKKQKDIPGPKVAVSLEVQHISNIIDSMTKYMGINLDSKHQFIINNVIQMQKLNIPSEKKYNEIVSKAKTKDKTAKLPEYKDVFNQSLVLLTLAYILISIQTTIPDIKSKKTFPNCIKSFKGYPIDGEQDKSGLNYIVCIANKIKTNIEPWSSILKASENQLLKKIETIIEKNILPNKLILELFDKKREYRLTQDKSEDSVDDKIDKWLSFLPPLARITINSENQLSISSGLKSNYKELIKTSKDYSVNIFKSKVLYISGAIIESIEKIVKKNTPILSTNAGDPFLENACCSGKKSTIKYFIENDDSILQNIQLVNSLQLNIENIRSLYRASILYDVKSTKKTSIIDMNSYSESTIYKAFIHYCNFANDTPISDELRAICMDKPTSFKIEESMKLNIESLKQMGKVYNNDLLQELIVYISNKNIKFSDTDYTIISNQDNLSILLENVKLYDESITIFQEQYFTVMESLFNNSRVNNNELPELRHVKNYLGSINKSMKSTIDEYIKKHSTSSKKDIQFILTNLNLEFDINNIKICENYLFNFINVFPNIILNKNINPNDICKHWNLSKIHENDISKIVERYYSNLNKHNTKTYFKLVFDIIKTKCQVLDKMIKLTKLVRTIYLDKEKTKFLQSVFDSDYILLFYKFCIYTLLYEFVTIKNNQLFNIEINEFSDYESTTFDNTICGIIESYLTIFFNNYNIVSLGYKKIIDKINIAKENEKNQITDYLKKLTDEEREIQNIFKHNKLEQWSVGLQKGMTQYVKTNYDAEREKLEKQLELDKKLNKNPHVTAMNSEIYKLDIEDEEQIQADIDSEEYDMGNIPDDDNMSDITNNDVYIEDLGSDNESELEDEIDELELDKDY